MLRKKGLVKLAAASLVFAAFGIWIYSSLLGSYRSYSLENSLNKVTLFARTAPDFTLPGNGEDALLPADRFAIDNWIAGFAEVVEGGQILLLGSDENFNFYPVAADALPLALWESGRGNQVFEEAEQSVYYLLPYTFARSFSARELRSLDGVDPASVTSSMQAYLLPIPDDSGFDIRAAVFITVPEEGSRVFERLLRNLFILAWVIFIVIVAVALLARDPVTGYAVVFLFAVAAAFIAYPLFETFRLTFVQDGSATFDIWRDAVRPRNLQALWGSVQLGICTASVSTFIGFVFAFYIERTGARHKKLIGTLATMPVISPPFSLSLSVILLFGNNGLITNQLLGLRNFSIYGLGGLVLVQTIGMFPIAFMSISSILKSIDSTIEDAALDLQATRLKTFTSVTLPLAMPGILSAWLLVFTNSLADFANPLLLAGSYRVLSVEAYIIVTGRSNLGGGAALSLMLLMPTLTAFFIQRYWVGKKSVVTVTGKPSSRLAELATKPVRIALAVFVGLCLVFIMSLYGTILAGCFVRAWGIDYSFTLSNFSEALSRGWQSISNTVTLAAIATPIAGITAMAAALIVVRQTFIGKRLLEVLLMTPFAVPGTLIGISYILAFNRPPLILVGTAAIIVINYVVRELPVGLETGAANLRQIDKSIEEAAQDLGADMPKVFTSIVLPLIRPSFLTAMSYTFVRSMTAVSAVIFLISARWYHLTVQIYNFSENLRFGLASVLSTVLIIIVLSVFGLMQVLVRDRGMTAKTISR
ncbi:MAG: iron ABC transporter permease [Treponema sp.]|nr:iron ABC transporter permease [Treponema sp.]